MKFGHGATRAFEDFMTQYGWTLFVFIIAGIFTSVIFIFRRVVRPILDSAKDAHSDNPEIIKKAEKTMTATLSQFIADGDKISKQFAGELDSSLGTPNGNFILIERRNTINYDEREIEFLGVITTINGERHLRLRTRIKNKPYPNNLAKRLKYFLFTPNINLNSYWYFDHTISPEACKKIFSILGDDEGDFLKKIETTDFSKKYPKFEKYINFGTIDSSPTKFSHIEGKQIISAAIGKIENEVLFVLEIIDSDHAQPPLYSFGRSGRDGLRELLRKIT